MDPVHKGGPCFVLSCFNLTGMFFRAFILLVTVIFYCIHAAKSARHNSSNFFGRLWYLLIRLSDSIIIFRAIRYSS